MLNIGRENIFYFNLIIEITNNSSFIEIFSFLFSISVIYFKKYNETGGCDAA